MKLDLLQVTDFRNLEPLKLDLSPQLNVFRGINGSGKSSILEAVHFLGFGRSFRTTKHKHVIQHGKNKFSVFCRCYNQEQGELRYGLSRSVNGEVVCNVNGEKSQKVSDLVSQLPVQIFTPQSTDLIIGSPKQRRKFLDWGLFHVEHSFYSLNATYQRLLKQRNSLLRSLAKKRSNQVDEVLFWDKQLVTAGEALNELRNAYVTSLRPYLSTNLSHFMTEFLPEISYHRGWENGLTFAESLAKKFEADRRYGFTSVGPHKADVIVKIRQSPAAEVLSRGQLRMLVAAMQLSQTHLLAAKTGKQSVFLLDDVGAELDEKRRKEFVEALIESGAQLLVTAIEAQQMEFAGHYSKKKMFHVEHGHVKEE